MQHTQTGKGMQQQHNVHPTKTGLSSNDPHTKHVKHVHGR